MNIPRSKPQLFPSRRSLAAAVLFALTGTAAALTPTDAYFSTPPGAGSTYDAYQWALNPGWMNFTEAWDYNTGTARIAIRDGGAVPIYGNEYSVPHYGSWDFTARSQIVCSLTLFFGEGCASESNPGIYAPFITASVPLNYYFGQFSDIDLTVQGPAHNDIAADVWNLDTQSWDIRTSIWFEEVPGPTTGNATIGAIHGTHVYASVKARHSNAISGGTGGIAGACADCSVLSTRTNNVGGYPNQSVALFSPIDALNWMIGGGAQVLSASYGAESNAAACNPNAVTPGESSWCGLLRYAKTRDVLFFAASGNGLSGVDLPARDPMAIAVGGADLQKRLWDERLYGQEAGDVASGCPASHNSTVNTYNECGSNSDAQLDFVAPARRILGLVPPGKSYAGAVSICGDNNFGAESDGVGFCSGTSMSTPLVAAAGGLIRSVNPLLQRDAVYETLKQTADGNQVFTSRGWGMPNVGNAVKRALGTSGHQQMQNRLTPMFVIKATGDRLYTVAPQLAVSAYNGSFAGGPYSARNPSDFAMGIGLQTETGPTYRNPTTEANPVRPTTSNYLYPGLEAYGYFARSSFYVFSGKRSMFGVSMRPMERLLSVKACDSRENTFGFTRNCPNANGTESLEPRTFLPDGIEGYLLATCPAQFGSCNNFADPSTPQAVYLRYSATYKSFALLLDSQLTEPQFSTYLPIASQPASSAPLGYAFKNVDTDSDGLIDGAERVLGTNRLVADSDCDGQNDGVEYPTLLMQTTAQDPLVGPCGIP